MDETKLILLIILPSIHISKSLCWAPKTNIMPRQLYLHKENKAPFEAGVGGEMSWGAAEMRSEVGAGASVVAAAITSTHLKSILEENQQVLQMDLIWNLAGKVGEELKKSPWFQVLAKAWGVVHISAMEGSVASVEEKTEFPFGCDAFELARDPPNGAVM